MSFTYLSSSSELLNLSSFLFPRRLKVLKYLLNCIKKYQSLIIFKYFEQFCETAQIQNKKFLEALTQMNFRVFNKVWQKNKSFLLKKNISFTCKFLYTDFSYYLHKGFLSILWWSDVKVWVMVSLMGPCADWLPFPHSMTHYKMRKLENFSWE